jgi:CRP/FNR family transcriptional regulator
MFAAGPTSLVANLELRLGLEVAKESSGRCQQCPTHDACIAAKLEPNRLEELPNWLTEGATLNAGQHLYRAGDSADQQYHVRSGMFKTVVLNAQGDEFISGFHLPGDVLGVVHDRGCHVDSAVALDSGTACELNTNQLANNPDQGISSALIAHLSERTLGNLEHQISLSQSSAQARFAAFCVNYSDKLVRLRRCAHFLPTPMSRTDLANYLGMTLESLSRVISKLNASGVIRAARDNIELTQPDTLKTFSVHTTL